jgi:hypothetical protein
MSKNTSQGQFQIPCTEVAPKSGLKNTSQSMIFSAITQTDALWRPGDKGTITITFGGYGCDGCSPDAAWSQIGNNSTDNYPSMNLGFIDPPYTSFTFNGKTYTPPANATRNYCGTSGPGSCTAGWVPGATVVHEFGHALGMLHEHQNNLNDANPIELDRSQVVAYYNCVGMGESGAVTNVLDTYMCKAGETCNYAGTKFDPLSIMLYSLPSAWIEGCTPYPNLSDCNGLLRASQTCSKNPTKPNFVLSPEDIGWLQQKYPLNSTDPPEITVKFIDPNPEPWKVAWVQKMVTETYGQLLGIKWIFDTDRILGSTTGPTSGPTYKPTTGPTYKPTTGPTPGPTYKPTPGPTTTPTSTLAPIKPLISASVIDINKIDAQGNVVGTGMTPTNLLLAIILPIVGVILIFLFIFRKPILKKLGFA